LRGISADSINRQAVLTVSTALLGSCLVIAFAVAFIHMLVLINFSITAQIDRSTAYAEISVLTQKNQHAM
jgi:hypothetical protein